MNVEMLEHQGARLWLEARHEAVGWLGAGAERGKETDEDAQEENPTLEPGSGLVFHLDIHYSSKPKNPVKWH